MKWTVYTLLSFALLMGTPMAAAEDHDGIMGNYEGSFTSGALDGKAIRGEVFALNEHSWDVALITEDERIIFGARKRRPEDAKASLRPARDREENVVLPTGDGILDLEVEGELGHDTLSGTVTIDGASSAFELGRFFFEPPSRGAEPPAGAVVLMDGTNLDMWTRYPEKWCLGPDGSAQVCDSNFMTKEQWGSHKLHIDFMTPFMPGSRGQSRGNSGVYVHGRYEVQVLDCFGIPKADNHCGGIYKKAVPIVNACLPPLEWQTYDITFTAPEFDSAGAKTKNARITVVHNGTTIHDDVELDGSTPGGITEVEGPLGPLWLQDHGDPVKFRNIWVQPL